MATNVYGDSIESPIGGGGIIVRVPDAVIDFVEVYGERTPTTIGMSWADGAEDGGLAVLDYQVNIAEVGGDYSVFATNVPDQSFVATGLTFGTTYKFTI